jgi:acyl carrier protein
MFDLPDMRSALMANLEKYRQTFVESLEIDESQLGADLLYQSVETWDSVGHMQLVATLEDAFDIMLDTDDIIDLSSYLAGIEILKKYDVSFD